MIITIAYINFMLLLIIMAVLDQGTILVSVKIKRKMFGFNMMILQPKSFLI